jgi:hypothetical protein
MISGHLHQFAVVEEVGAAVPGVAELDVAAGVDDRPR